MRRTTGAVSGSTTQSLIPAAALSRCGWGAFVGKTSWNWSPDEAHFGPGQLVSVVAFAADDSGAGELFDERPGNVRGHNQEMGSPCSIKRFTALPQKRPS